MKTNWPAYRLTLMLLVSLVLVARPIGARPAPTSQTVRVDAQVSARAVHIEVKATGPFEYTTTRVTEHLLDVDLAGVESAEPTGARVLDSAVVSSYRILQAGTKENPVVRLEILLRSAAEPKIERSSNDRLTLVFDASSASDSPAAAATAPTNMGSAATGPVIITGVEVARSGQEVNVRVQATGHLAYQAERLEDPARLVLDFSGARLALSKSLIPTTLKPVRKVRLSQFNADVARVVIDLDRGVPYALKTEEESVTIAFAAPAPSSGPAGSQLLRRDDKATAPRLTGTVRRTSMRPAAIQPAKLPLPESLTQHTTGLASPAAKTQQSAPASPDQGQQTQTPQTPAPPAQTQQSATSATPARPPVKYTGEPISVNLKDVDLKDFFRLIHEISGLNVVLDPAVKGTVTLVLDDVPWDQALDIVLKNNNLDKQLDGNVLRIATQDTLKKEAETRRDLAKAEAEAVDQVTATRVLSYAKATAVRDTLKRFLSARGDILSDERSNTLIIRDIPSVIPVVDNLIRQLDKKAQQVEIEARVVAASRSFARDIGSQFGIGTTATGGRSIFSGASAVGTSPFSCPAPCPLPPPPVVVSSTTSIPLNTNLSASGPTSGVSFIHRSPNFSLDYVITAAESKGVGKLLSKPKIITQNNEKATVKQGTKIPVQTTINNTISVQFIDAVLKLEVTPQITAEGTVFMDVVVENTQIDQGIPRVQGIPALDTQSAETKVLINDGGTVVIGGVIISSQRTDIQQVPLFGSIPVIGNLFKRSTVNVQSQELLFFLTPRIVPG